MSYTLKLYAFEEASPEQLQAAELRFKSTLDGMLGDPGLVLPVYQAYRRIVGIYGDAPPPETLTDAEQQIFDQWQAAETAALTAALGPDRYMGEAQFEINA